MIEGLYSYRSRTTIDFTGLTAARLFGIFGPVGSGKSTLIEAMSIAVYGDTTRLNARGDNRVYNLLNLRSDRLWIDFVFSLGEDRRFRFTAEAKRRSTDFETVGSLDRAAYRWTGDEWRPLESVSGESVLGMSYDNFRRTVIIPQGHFQEFLQLRPAERTKMLKELFSLDRFDLYRNTKTLFDSARTRVETIDALLAEIPEDLESVLDEIRTKIATNMEKRRALVVAKDNAVQRRDRLQAVVELTRERAVLEQRLAALGAQREEVDVQRMRVERLEAVRDHLLSPFREVERAQTALSEGEARKAEVERALEPIRQKRIAAETRRDALTERERERPAMESRRDALSVYREILTIDAEEGKIDALLAEGNGELSEITAALQFETDRHNALVAERGALQTDLPATDDLRRYEARLHHQKQLQDTKDSLGSIAERVTALQAEWDLPGHDVARPASLSLWATRLAKRIGAFRDLVTEHLITEEHRLHLVELSTALKDGQPCPLCGATDHPAPFAAISSNGTTISATVKAREELERLRGRCELIAEGLTEGEDEVQGVDVDEDTIAVWWRAHDRVSKLNEQIAEAQQRREELQVRVNATTSHHAEAAGRRKELSRRRDALRRQIPEGTEAPSTLEEIEREIRSIDDSLASLQSELEAIRTTHDEVTREEARLTAVVSERSETVARSAGELDGATELLRRTLGAGPIAALSDISEDTLPGLVAELPNIAAIRRRIETFDQEHREAQRELSRITEQIAAQSDEPSGTETIGSIAESSEARLAEILWEIDSIDGKIQATDNETGELRNSYTTKETELGRRTELEAERRSVDVRREGLFTLVKLFEGSKFVRYVSQVFLEQLVAAANARFRRLTRNRLELALRDGQEFEVVDYLNGGRRRNVKTLSGGQTFQAALCLALALVDSVDRSSGGSSPGFFFLDEGFGSLDEDSLREVFVTLDDLRREDRIVGIISHVESLKQEIDTYLQVFADEERGSTIR